MTDFDLSKYVYWEYSLAVLLVTEVFRVLLAKSTNKVVKAIVVDQPKWLSLIVASFLAFLDWIVISNGQNFHLWQFTISFGVAVLGYDYALKLIKDYIARIRGTNTGPKVDGQ